MRPKSDVFVIMPRFSGPILLTGGTGGECKSPIPDYSACEIKYFAYVGDSKMKTICGRILVAMALLGALAGCASMIGEGVSVNPTSPPVYGAYADE